MLTFKQFLTESGTGNYVSIDVSTPIKIDGLEKNFPDATVCDTHHQHVTLIYSEGTNVAPEKIKNLLRDNKKKIVVDAGEVAAFDALPKDGERDENMCTIVVKLKSKELETIHKRLKNDLGMRHSYPDFSPHISVMYNLPRDQKEKAMEVVGKWVKDNMLNFTLEHFNINPIVKNWSDDKGKK
jgi:hypothetical protein